MIRYPKLLYGIFVQYWNGKYELHAATPSKRKAAKLHDAAHTIPNVRLVTTMPFWKGKRTKVTP